MNLNEDKHDKQIHENLLVIGQKGKRPRDPRPEQIDRWVRLVRRPKRPGILRFASILRRHPIASLVSSGAAAAIFILAVLGGMGFLSQSISADEVFAQVGKTLAGSPAVCWTVRDVAYSGHKINMRAYGGERGEALYGELKAEALSKLSKPRMDVNMTIALKGEEGWFLIRRFAFDGCPVFGDLIPKKGGLLIPWSVPPKACQAVQKCLPAVVNLTDVQTFVESLRKAVPDLTVKKLPNGTVALEGVVTKPELLNLSALRSAIDVTNIAGRIIPGIVLHADDPNAAERISGMAAIAKAVLEDKLEGEELELARRRIDIIKELATQQLRTPSDEETAKKHQARRRQLKADVRKLIAGSRVRITYDPKEKLLKTVRFSNVGQREGLLLVEFDASRFDRSLLDSKRLRADPNVRSMTKEEFIQAVFMSLLMPATAPAEPGSEK